MQSRKDLLQAMQELGARELLERGPAAQKPAAELKPPKAPPEYPERAFMINARVVIQKEGSSYAGCRGWIKGFRFGKFEPEYAVKLDGVNTKVVFPQSQLKEGDLLIAHGGFIAQP